MNLSQIKTSGFALIDITKGRLQLAASLKKHKPPVGRPATEGYPVTITGYLTSQWGDNDGTSIEFEIDVKTLVISPLETIV